MFVELPTEGKRTGTVLLRASRIMGLRERGKKSTYVWTVADDEWLVHLPLDQVIQRIEAAFLREQIIAASAEKDGFSPAEFIGGGFTVDPDDQ